MKMKVVEEEEEEDKRSYREIHSREAGLAQMLNFQNKKMMKMKKDTEE